MIEWYDFVIFISLAPVLALHFFPADNPTFAFLSTLAVFAAGFIARPFGAVFFGLLGDLVGRKYSFLLSLTVMGAATLGIGVLPGYATLGALAPFLVVVCRLLQGLALGGEYGGAVIYLGEHTEKNRRGFLTSWIQTTATLSFVVALGVIALLRGMMTEESFQAWGWRLPFLFSAALFVVSLYIRLRMAESPAFAALKAAGGTSKRPLRESFLKRGNLKYILLALLGAAMGQGVVAHTAQFYALSFIQKSGVDFVQANLIALCALSLATPLYILFGWASDRISRKWIMLLGMLLAVVSYRPIFRAIEHQVNPLHKTFVRAQAEDPSEKTRDGKKWLVLEEKSFYQDGSVVTSSSLIELGEAGAVKQAPARTAIVLGAQSFVLVIGLFWLLGIMMAMTYGPIAAFLVELFPVRLRYTSLSVSYHLGSGVFGGLVPFIASSLVVSATASGQPEAFLVGLNYPIFIASLCLVIGVLYLRSDTHERKAV